ncbi:TPA: chorismate synthase [bacterium]|nr:chorismate synthase [bacterium]
MLRFLTAGESHGPSITAIIEGLPAGISIEKALIDEVLKRRQMGYGRGKRMEIESDKVEIIGGVRKGKTIGGPISIVIKNRDWENWKEKWDKLEPILSPRPGHADLVGAIKYRHLDIRNVLERSSARETAARVCVGAICKIFLLNFNIDVLGYVLGIGRIKTEKRPKNYEEIKDSLFFCADKEYEKRMVKEIDIACENGDTVGGIFEVKAEGIPPGLGSYVHWDRRLDCQLAGAIMSIPGVKGVEIGLGFGYAEKLGSEVHDEIFYKDRFFRKTNNCGGIEGGVSNGESIIIRGVMKPIPTLKKPLSSVNIETKKETKASYERSDVCAVPACSVIGEAMVSFVIAQVFLERFGSDNMEMIEKTYREVVLI